MLLKILFAFAIFGMTSCAPQSYKTKEMTLEKIVNSSHRSAENKARDKFRNPIKTLEFFEVKPEMTVVEVSPGKGWYTEILGPYLKDSGTLYLTLFSENSKRSYAAPSNKAVKKMTSNKKRFGKVNYTTLELPDDMGPIAPAGSADRVLTFRNAHSWANSGNGVKAFKTFFDALKPGGILGVVEHREPSSRKIDPKLRSGYMQEKHVIKIAEKAGFKLVAKSEINANSKDTADHVGGVWALPPSLRHKDKNKEKYMDIGESDRMTLKFVKPLKK
jgi:predicted methyltransferase